MLAVALGFTACSNEDEVLSVKGGKTTVLAMTETGTRTALESDGEGAYNVVWSEGDYIYDFAGNKIYNISSGAGSTTAKFTGPAVKPNQYIAYLYGTGNDYPTWPTCQTYKANTVDVFPMRAVGISDADGNLSPLQFKNFGGVLRLNVKGTATIKKIVVSANEYMSGELSMSWQSTAIDPIAAQISTYTGINSIELNCGTGVALDATDGTDFYIAVPANTYTGVEITLTDIAGNTLTKKFKGTDGLKIERSKITKASFKIAPPTKGKAEATIDGVKTDVNWVQLWAGGPKFAEYNVGATSATEYGGYYTWGGTYKNGKDIDWCDDHNTGITGTGDLTGADDTATKLWGDNWRMPTKAEFEALLNSDNCDVKWTTVNNVNGRKFTGKGDYASNSVFLPAAGYCDGGNVNSPGYYGYYWPSSPYGSYDNTSGAYSLFFSSGSQGMYSYSRSYGYSVRAVLKED